jgi:uncharacterized HhH-GPD family protein
MNHRELPIKSITDAETANAFLFGLIFNQNQRAEQAWAAPYKLKERLGTLEPERILCIPLGTLVDKISERPALHPFAFTMGKSIYAACVLLQEKYNSDARNIWRRKRSASEVLKRLKEFRGIGEHKAQVGVFLLKNELGIAVGEDDTTLDIRKTCGSLYALYGEGK